MRSLLVFIALSLSSALNVTLIEVNNNKTRFVEIIKDHLESGWQLAGSHATSAYGHNNRNILYTQAMIKP